MGVEREPTPVTGPDGRLHVVCPCTPGVAMALGVGRSQQCLNCNTLYARPVHIIFAIKLPALCTTPVKGLTTHNGRC
jgi:hypothetical protein